MGFMTMFYRQMQSTNTALLEALNDRPGAADALYPSAEFVFHRGSVDGPVAAGVRRAALSWYASRIHPNRSVTEPFAIATPAGKSLPDIERLLTGMTDENFNVRRAAVLALGAYRNAGDPRVRQALEKALDDTKHKVCHAAARILGVRCPGCGRTR